MDCQPFSFLYKDHRPDIFKLSIILIFSVVSFFHLLYLSHIPRGLYCDESSIGYNAFLIAKTGYDEHAKFFPVFFEAFGEFKNPLFIYLTSLIFKFCGISEFNLRLTSFVFYFLFLMALFLLIVRMFKNNRIICVYVLLSAGFLPWFFTISRIAFECISQLTLVVYTLLFILETFHPQEKNRGWLNALLAGSFMALSVYTYSTARLLSFLLLFSLLLVYFRKANIKKILVLLVAFFAMLIPYISFCIDNPGALTARFRGMTYVFDASLGIFRRGCIFLSRYLSHFGLDFLLFKGDANLRHATGRGGELYLTVFLLFIIGLFGIIIKKQLARDKYSLLLFINLLFSPVASALTIGTTHALRSILTGLYILIFSCYGLFFLSLIKINAVRIIIFTAVFASLTFQSFIYVTDYFTAYPSKSIVWFKSYDFKRALTEAIQQKPGKIIVSNKANQPYIHLEFYKNLVSNKEQIPVYIDEPLPRDNSCIIYFSWNEALLKQYNRKSIEIDTGERSIVKLRCYK